MKKFIILLFVGLVAFSAIESKAQVYNLLSPYGIASDTAVNTTPTFLSSAAIAPAPAVTSTIEVSVTKLTGTVAGTITLQGSMNGTSWKALNTPNTVTALATHTATDASATYHWIITGSPFPYYRVSWTGVGTMTASFTAKLFRSK